MRDLPAAAAFADEIILALGEGSKTVVAEGDWPVSAVAFASRHILLVRDHGHALTLSLPQGEQSWRMVTRHDWLAALAEIKTAIAAYQKLHPRALSMTDAIIALNLHQWVPDFPGTPVPTEAWLKNAGEPELSIGIFQHGDAVRVVVWVGDDMRSQIISSPQRLVSLPAWIAPQIDDQREAEKRRAAEEARRRALPLPELTEVLARLEAGERISTGGGRYFEIYFIENGKLRCEVFDEGHTQVFDATEKELQRSIEVLPDRFRKNHETRSSP